MTAMDKQEVDPALWPLVEGFPPIDVTAETLAGFREALVGMSVMPEASTHPDVRIEEVMISGGGNAAPGVRCLVQADAACIYCGTAAYHGGGFVMGTVEMDGGAQHRAGARHRLRHPVGGLPPGT